MFKMTAHFTEIVQWYARDIGAGPGGYLAVAVFTDDEGVDTAAVHIKMLTEQIFEPCRIQYGTGTEDPIFRKTGKLDRCACENVHGI